MRKIARSFATAAVAVCLAFAGSAPPAAAATARDYAHQGKQAAHLPGSRGFQATCSATFATSNSVRQSNTFNTTPWALGGAVVAAPTIASTTATAPDGTTTATTLTIPTVTGANAYSFLYQAISTWANSTAAASYPETASIWVQNTTPGNGTASFMIVNSTSTAWQTVSVPNDGRWHQMVVYTPGGYYSANPYFVVGVDTRDAKQKATTGVLTINVWEGQVSGGRGPGGGQWPYIATAATVPVNATQTIPCTPGLAFRDYSLLKPYSGNFFPMQNASEAWQAGGVSPFFAQSFKVGDTYYAMANSTDATNHNDWFAFSLYAGKSPFALTEVSGPVLQIPGSDYTNGTVGTSTNMKVYMLHPAYSPNGCTVSGTFHAYCVYASASNATTASGAPAGQNVFLAYADAITGPYTWYPSNSAPGNLTPYSGLNSTANNSTIPGILTDGTTNFLYLTNNNNGATRTNVWTSPVGDGVNWTFAAQVINPVLSADWDYSGFQAYNDSYPIKNACGFYELYYTTLSSAVGPQNVRQRIGVMISDNPLGPWFKAPGPVIPATSGMYGGTPYIGDTSILIRKGTFIWSGNIDNASNLSSGVLATMPDACSY